MDGSLTYEQTCSTDREWCFHSVEQIYLSYKIKRYVGASAKYALLTHKTTLKASKWLRKLVHADEKISHDP